MVEAENTKNIRIARHEANRVLPVNRLPDELLSDILLQCGKYVKDSEGQWHSPFNTCQIWRNVAVHATPRLWTEIKHQGITDTGSLKKFEVWIQRSKALPIDFELGDGLPNRGSTLSEPAARRVVDALRPGLIKARTVRNFIIMPSLCKSVLDLCATSPFIESLVLYLDWHRLAEASSASPAPILPQAAASLEELVCFIPPLPPTSRLMISPEGYWPSLQALRISIGDEFGTEMHKILRNAPTLETIEWISLSSQRAPKEDHLLWEKDPVTLNFLWALHLDGPGPLNFFHHIGAPNLFRLRLSDHNEQMDENELVSAVGIKTLFPLLHDMQLDFSLHDHEFSIALARNHPTLHIIQITCLSAVYEFLYNRSDELCPDLCMLIIGSDRQRYEPHQLLNIGDDYASDLFEIVEEYVQDEDIKSPVNIEFYRARGATWNRRTRELAEEYPHLVSFDPV